MDTYFDNSQGVIEGGEITFAVKKGKQTSLNHLKRQLTLPKLLFLCKFYMEHLTYLFRCFRCIIIERF